MAQVALTAFENELGVQAPVGFWDPAGFTADGDVAAFKRRRSVELKHGRISMMATMGALVAGRLSIHTRGKMSKFSRTHYVYRMQYVVPGTFQ